jgi:hypothetical protein
VFGGCTAGDAPSGVVAVLSCSGTDPRVTRLEVVQVPDAGTLATRFSALSQDRGLVNRRCADETRNSGGFWTRAGARQGAFACFQDARQQRRLLWQYDAQAIEVQAVGRDGTPASAADLYTWWTSEARNRPISG